VGDSRKATIQQAASTTVDSCEHGTITVYLLDAQGHVFAAASYDPDQALALLDAVSGELQAYLKARGMPVQEDAAPSRRPH